VGKREETKDGDGDGAVAFGRKKCLAGLDHLEIVWLEGGR